MASNHLYKFIVLLFIIVSSNANSGEIDFSSYYPDGKVISELIVELDGKSTTKEYIVSYTSNDYLKMEKEVEGFKAGVSLVYVFIIEKNKIVESIKLNNERGILLQIWYNDLLKKYFNASSIGPVYDFFFIKDLNNNGKQEFYYVDYAQYDSYFVGYEYDEGKLKEVIDVEIEEFYKYNFRVVNNGDLWLLRPYNGQDSNYVVYGFNPNLAIFELTEQGTVTVKEDDLFIGE